MTRKKEWVGDEYDSTRYRVDSLKDCIGKHIEIIFSKGRTLRGTLNEIDERFLKVYILEHSGHFTEGEIRYIVQIQWPKGYKPRMPNHYQREVEDDGELPTDANGNHIKPGSEKKD